MSGLKKITFFIFTLVVTLVVLQLTFDKTVIYDYSVKQFLNQSISDKKLDCIFIGSSTTQCNINIPVFNNITNGTSFNMAVGGCAVEEQLLILNSFLKNNNKVSTLLIGIDIYTLDTNCYEYPFSEYAYLPFIDEDYIFEHIKMLKGNKAYLWKYLPFYKYIEFNSQIGVKNFLNIYYKNKRTDNFGSLLLSDTLKPFVSGKTSFGHHSIRQYYLEKIIRLAKDNNIRTVLFTPPQFMEVYNNQIGRSGIINKFKEISGKYNVPYLNYSDLNMNVVKNYFVDPDHFNKHGSIEFTKHLANDINSIIVN